MQFLSVSRRRSESFTDADFAALAPDEQEQARRLYAEGVIRQIWHRADVGGACIVVEADSEAEARERLNSLPMFSRGMLEVTIIPLKPYAGFGPRQK
jgi:muconolactone delta-isomerase